MGFFDSASPAISFNRLGDSVTGIIDGPYVERQVMEFGSTTKLKFYSDGRPWMAALIPLRTNERDQAIANDDGVRTLWVDKISMRDAIIAAFKATGAKDLETGGTLTVQYVGDEDSGKGNPSKLFAAQYVRPVGMLGQPQAGGNGAATQQAAQYVSSAPQYAQQPQGYPQQQAAPAFIPQQPAPLYAPAQPLPAQVAQVPQGPNLMPQGASQSPQQANGAPGAGEQIAAIRAMAGAGMTAVQISQAVPAFTPEAVQAVLGLPA